MGIYTSVTELIGGTPLLRLGALERRLGLDTALLAKLEARNPAGSAKDRVALAIVEDAEAKGALRPGATIIEPTSGNTGIGLAAVAAARGYKAVFTMPESMSLERRKLLAAYGAQVVLTPAAAGMAGAIAEAERLHAGTPGSFLAGQFTNPANPEAHYRTTGPELWADTDGKLDALVAGVGTGGTLSGAGRYLKEQNPAITLVAVEPAGSPVLSGGAPGPHGLMGIGAGFVPETLDRAVLDRIMTATEEEAYAAARELAAAEGILCGISGGAALWAAMALAQEPAWRGRTIALILPDGGERYLSTPLYS